MLRSLVYLTYNLFLPLLLVLGVPLYLVKGIRRGGLARNFRQRLGFFRPETLSRFKDRNPIWIHAVSVGEVFLALKIIDAIRNAKADQAIVLSTTTTTGYGVAIEKESSNLTVIHNPIDLPFVTARVIRLINPTKVALVEAEVWPNFVNQLSRRKIPVLLVNARLSPRSEKRYLKVRKFIEPIFSQLDGVSVPFEADRSRWSRLGIPLDRIHVTGSVKFDNADQSSSVAELRSTLAGWLAGTGMPATHRILLAGSTHSGEEALIAMVASELRETIPDLFLVIVPRHAERGGEIASQLRAMRFDPILRREPNRVETSTQQGSSSEESHPLEMMSSGERIWIANTTGELRSWFHLAEVVIIGKSFRSVGGQNPVEPILSGKPVVVGPHMENFAEVVAELREAEGICQLKGEEQLKEAVRGLFDNPEKGREMAARGARTMARHEGAAARTAGFILSF